jgi:hypothetical protein
VNRAIVLVEGMSDKIALETLAARRHQDLESAGVSVLAMSGAHAICRFLAKYRDEARLAGLCDEGEEDVFRRCLEQAGFGAQTSREEMARTGFYVCVEDLEDELIRAAGAPLVEDALRGQGELAAFRRMQKEPAWRGRPVEAQLRRFLGNAERKARYARLIVEALDLDSIPRPLDAVLTYVL